MNDQHEQLILKATQAKSAKEIETIQTLWSGYGKIVRVELLGGEEKTIILKHIVVPIQKNHPRGWNTNSSHQRKLKSYQVEMEWYKTWGIRCDDTCIIPRCYASEVIDNERLIVLEDLDLSGFSIRKSFLTKDEIKVCIEWLANFHATFLEEEPIGLWEQGTYWHLSTRPDEFEAMEEGALKDAAQRFDKILNNCQYKTIVHGDAKVANFCFSKNLDKVAAVDFQYVGGGCGMKDFIYLLGSCMDEDACEQYEKELLDFYFLTLKQAIRKHDKTVDWLDLEKEWRSMYALAWADFSRFLMGWAPTHQKINSYTGKLVQKALLHIEQ